ncbi:MAG: sulfurtransferase [Flavobacteriaceae bacterium]
MKQILTDALKIISPLVSVNWLQQHIDATNLVILDATLPKVTSTEIEDNFEKLQIPNAIFLDIKEIFSDNGAEFPNTMLSREDFENEAQKLGINNDSCIVVYDQHGIYSSPRVWWMFKTMGFDNIAVLDGGLPAWNKAGFDLVEPIHKDIKKGDFTASYNENMILEFTDVLKSLQENNTQIFDARSSGRFKGIDPEPRDKVRSGHIPKSKSLPYSSLLNGVQMKSKKELKELFNKQNADNKPMIFSCGTGITACVLALGATVSGATSISIYDGSWTEWGSLHNLPIEI